MSSLEVEETVAPPRRKVSCTAYFDALWFCYSPVHQVQNYYRLGSLDNCSQKWSVLFDCLKLKTKRASELRLFWKTGRNQNLTYGPIGHLKKLQLTGKSFLGTWMKLNKCCTIFSSQFYLSLYPFLWGRS